MKLKGDIKNIQRASIGNKKGRSPLGNTPFNLKKIFVPFINAFLPSEALK